MGLSRKTTSTTQKSSTSSSTVYITRRLTVNALGLDPEQVDNKNHVLNQMMSLVNQRSQTGDSIAPSQLDRRLLDHAGAVIGKLPTSGDASVVKLLKEQQQTLTKSLEEQEKKDIDLREKFDKYIHDQQKRFGDLVKIGALTASAMSYSLPVKSQMEQEFKIQRGMDAEIKRNADQRLQLRDKIMKHTESVLRRQPDAPSLAMIVPSDERHLVRGVH